MITGRPNIYRLKVIANELNVSTAYLRKKIKEGKLEAYRIGKTNFYVTEEALKNFKIYLYADTKGLDYKETKKAINDYEKSKEENLNYANNIYKLLLDNLTQQLKK